MATGGTFYVDTASTGGDGTTRNHSGATAAFASSSLAEAALQGTLTSDLIVRCQGGADSTALAISGWTTGASARLIWEADDGVGGTGTYDNDGEFTGDAAFSSSHYRFAGATSYYIQCFENFVTIQRLQFEMTSVQTNRRCIRLVSVPSGGSDIRIHRNRFKHNGTGTNWDAIENIDADATAEIFANIIDWDTDAGEMAIVCALGVSEVYNNTIVNANTGISLTGGTNNVHNNVIAECGDDVSETGGTNVIQFNAADDDLDTELTESNNVILSVTRGDDFTDFAGGDYTPVSGGAMADAGTTGGPSTDINEVAYGTEDIGCFNFVAAAGGGRIMSSMAGHGGLVGSGGIAGQGGGLAG